MISKILEVKNKTGLHARPISQIIKVISPHKSKNLITEDEGIKATVEAVDIKSLESIIDQVDVYVTIVPGSQTFDKPMINGIKFLTGMGMAEEFEKLKELLK